MLLLLGCGPVPGKAELDVATPQHVVCRESLETRGWEAQELSGFPLELGFALAWTLGSGPIGAGEELSLVLSADTTRDPSDATRVALGDQPCPDRVVWPVQGSLSLAGVQDVNASLRGTLDSLGTLRLAGDQTDWGQVGAANTAPDVWAVRADHEGGELRVSSRIDSSQLKTLWTASLQP